MLKRCLASLVLLCLCVGVANAGYWIITPFADGEATQMGPHGNASAYFGAHMGAPWATASASGWGNVDGETNGGIAHSWAGWAFRFHVDPCCPNQTSAGGKVFVTLITDQDTLAFGGIYGDGVGYVSASGSTTAVVSGVADWGSETYVYGNDSLSGDGTAEAWFSPWEELDEYGDGLHWSGVTEFEDPRYDAFVAEMDGRYGRLVTTTISPGTLNFSIRVDAEARVRCSVDESEGEPTTFVSSDADISTALGIDFSPTYPDYVEGNPQ